MYTFSRGGYKIMPRTKKTTATEKKSETPKSSKPVRKVPTITASKKLTASQQIAELEKKLDVTEKKLNLLVNILYGNLKKGQLQGPEGLAKELVGSGLLS